MSHSQPHQSDFICLLPVELVVEILVSLGVKDVLSCMSICRGWYDRIRHLQPYWSIALKRLGVPPSLQCEKDPFILAVQVWKGRQCTASSSPEIAYVSKCHLTHYYQCTYCRHGTVVATLYKDFIPFTTVVSKIQPGSKKLITKNQFPSKASSPSNRICWSTVYSDYLLMATANGRWLGYSLTTNAKLLDWKGPELYDQDITICCCEHCFVVASAKLVSQRKSQQPPSYWDVKIMTVGRGQVKPTLCNYLIPTPIYLPPGLASNGCNSVAMVSKATREGRAVKHDFCNNHLFLLHWANCIVVYRVDASLNIVPVTVFDIGIQSVTKEMVQSLNYRNSSCKMSSDNTLVGFIFSDELHSWDVDTLKPHATSVSLKRSMDYDSQVRLLALGHQYSLIGYESTNGQLKVVTTYTGECIFSTHGFSGVFGSKGVSPRTTPPYFIFLGVVDEHWLSDINALPHPSMPIVLYWEKKEHGVFGLVLKREVLKKHCSSVQGNANTMEIVSV